MLKAVHPSPLSAHRGFLGCKHFSQANEYLKKAGKKPIDWCNLPGDEKEACYNWHVLSSFTCTCTCTCTFAKNIVPVVIIVQYGSYQKWLSGHQLSVRTMCMFILTVF